MLRWSQPPVMQMPFSAAIKLGIRFGAYTLLSTMTCRAAGVAGRLERGAQPGQLLDARAELVDVAREPDAPGLLDALAQRSLRGRGRRCLRRGTGSPGRRSPRAVALGHKTTLRRHPGAAPARRRSTGRGATWRSGLRCPSNRGAAETGCAAGVRDLWRTHVAPAAEATEVATQPTRVVGAHRG